MTQAASVTVTIVSHDLVKQQFFVTLVWDDDATKRLVLSVPFGVGLAVIQPEAEKALHALSIETANLTINSP